MTGQPIAWTALEAGVPILGSDGTEIGTVDEVVADRQKDIFSGLSVSPGLLSSKRFVPADLIERMDTEAVRLTIPSQVAEERLDPYS